jgi:hypothetical protein
MAIIINFNKTTSENDIDDLKILLEDIRARFHFSWFVQGNQENNQSPRESGSLVSVEETKQNGMACNSLDTNNSNKDDNKPTQTFRHLFNKISRRTIPCETKQDKPFLHIEGISYPNTKQELNKEISKDYD